MALEKFGLCWVADNHHPSHHGHANHAYATKETVQKAVQNCLAPKQDPRDKRASWFDLTNRDEASVINFPRHGFEVDCFGQNPVQKEKCQLKVVDVQ